MRWVEICIHNRPNNYFVPSLSFSNSQLVYLSKCTKFSNHYLMLVAHLFGVNISIATIPMSILRLPRSIDCGGNLVNVWGLDYLCWINIHLYFFVAKHVLALLF